jgi:transcriptional regulator with XRE-family HTH domain
MTTSSPATRVADEVRAALARRRISQSALGVELGLSQSAVARRLTGEVPFDVAELSQIASFLEVPIASLVEVAA